jgi:UDP-N-acetylglucosamine acyltransferase
VIDADVVVGDDCRIGPHVHLTGHTTIGRGTHIHTGAVIGDEPQDLGFKGERSYTRIGEACQIREYVTIHRGSAPESCTLVGDRVMIMAYSHVGHNCSLASAVIIANATQLGGFVEIGERAFLSGIVGVHQFVRIGRVAMIGAMNRVMQDVPPFSLVQDGCVQGANVIGLRRAGIPAPTRTAIEAAIKLLLLSGLNRPNALARIQERFGHLAEIEEMSRFVAGTKRGILRGRGRKPAETEPTTAETSSDDA